MSSLYDSLDLEDIPSVPEDDAHPFKFTGATTSYNDQTEKEELILFFSLNDPSSAFHNFKVKKKLWLPTADDAAKNKADVIKAVNKNRAWLKGMGVPAEEIDNPDLSEYTGQDYLIYGAKWETPNGSEVWVARSIRVAS